MDYPHLRLVEQGGVDGRLVIFSPSSSHSYDVKVLDQTIRVESKALVERQADCNHASPRVTIQLLASGGIAFLI